MDGLHDSVREDVTIGLLDPALRLKTQRTVSVAVKIAPGPMERTVARPADPASKSRRAAVRAGGAGRRRRRRCAAAAMSSTRSTRKT